MNNEENVRANDLDSLIGDNHLQMMKAALPYMSVSQQRFISYFVKINELQRTINLFEEGEVATMGICSAGERSQSDSPIDMLNTIKPFANPAEQDLIDLVINFFQGFRLAGSFPDPVPSSTIPVQAQAQSQSQSQAQSQTQSEGPGRPANNQRQNNNPFGRMSFDQLKNFMPPDQQSKLETMQLMMSAMQQMN
ncbi:MAG: hypothetical protein E7243_18190 [Lacrimispora celerecrescens]|uniref:hypothetical protein n=1 Tax=Lacrimispora indolis TaxID=69825 RepID=UPI0004026D5B|nr:hypothetical protein [[Clostridium] methoxybenzovorans]MBE7721423.1 hypothetical protein [Lacrimispora celerecrescens]